MNYNTEWYEQDILTRFLRYVKIDTQSDRHVQEIPSTKKQWDLIHLLEKELKDMGIEDVSVDDHGYIIARLPATEGVKAETIAFMAHVDTAGDMSGKDVKPQVIENYDGNAITLNQEYSLDPVEFPELSKHKGETIITTDGTTLLGADDKAGLSEIMTALQFFLDNPSISHGEIEIVFTPDEETGKGMDLFPVEKLRSTFAYTLDGDHLGFIESECFNAYHVKVDCTGSVIHLGSARGKLVNAVSMAAQYISMLPRNESPEATDGRYGYYSALEIKGDLEKTSFDVFLRDFEIDEIHRRVDALKKIGIAIEAMFPGGTVEVKETKQYLNMRDHMAKVPNGLKYLEKAVKALDVEPVYKVIRGGTDGARLSEMGIPAPNIFTGGSNYHSRFEWASLQVMAKASMTVVNIIRLWAGENL
jgi:tripeptide aminopeptidase